MSSISVNHAATLSLTVVDVLRAAQRDNDPAHWKDSWDPKNLGKFLVLEHTIELKIPEGQIPGGVIKAVSRATSDLSRNRTQVTDEYTLSFQQTNGRPLEWTISKQQFEGLEYHFASIPQTGKDTGR
jgi:hypothetical protein